MWCLGEIRIGIITFEMLISVNNSNTNPNFTEVAEFIAQELEVDNLQVQLSYFVLTWFLILRVGFIAHELLPFKLI